MDEIEGERENKLVNELDGRKRRREIEREHQRGTIYVHQQAGGKRFALISASPQNPYHCWCRGTALL